MSAATDSVFDAELALPDALRAERAKRLLQSLDATQPILLSDA